MPPTPNPHICPATAADVPAIAADVPAIAAIGQRAFADEPIYERFFPRRAQHPRAYRRAFVREARRFLLTPGHVVMVAEVDAAEAGAVEAGAAEADAAETIKAGRERGPRVLVGYATFIRHGSPEELAGWNPDTACKAIQRTLFKIHTSLSSILRPDRSVCTATISNYHRQAAALHRSHLSPPSSPSCIDFRSLAVDPAHQGRGYGERLVEWCGVAAWQEDVPVFGDATARGLPLYLRNGCEEIGRIVMPAQSLDGGGRVLGPLEVVVLKWKT